MRSHCCRLIVSAAQGDATTKDLSPSVIMGSCMSSNSKILSEKRKQGKGKDAPPDSTAPNKRMKSRNREAELEDAEGHLPRKITINGATNIACLFTRQGQKGPNQDAMIVWEDFGCQDDTVFCGVFDGHGPHGHLVAQCVRDLLPPKLAANWQGLNFAADKEQSLSEYNKVLEDNSEEGRPTEGDRRLSSAWKESFSNSFMVMDKELGGGRSVDCFCSGTTAVTLVKQGSDVIIGNVGDSRAILGTMSDNGSLKAVQLTVDLKPNLPQEAERIMQCKGRVFAMHDEPDVYRVWLPHDNSPGLAMARAFGDFCLKNFGVISVPEVTHHRLTERDRFIVLATDGIWDVLSNEEVVGIVSSASARSFAAKAVVDMAVRAWRLKYPTSKVDDCAVVCLFTEEIQVVPSDHTHKKSCEASSSSSKQLLFPSTQNVREGDIPPAGTLRQTSKLTVTTKIKAFGSVSQSRSFPQQMEGTFLPVVTHSLRRGAVNLVPTKVDVSSCEHQMQADFLPPSSHEVCDNDEEVTGCQNEEHKSGKLTTAGTCDEDWTALDGVTRVNSLITLPRFVPDDMRAGG